MAKNLPWVPEPQKVKGEWERKGETRLWYPFLSFPWSFCFTIPFPRSQYFDSPRPWYPEYINMAQAKYRTMGKHEKVSVLKIKFGYMVLFFGTQGEQFLKSKKEYQHYLKVFGVRIDIFEQTRERKEAKEKIKRSKGSYLKQWRVRVCY